MENKLIEICRSASAKVNIGNFSSRDFFCSAKEECEVKDMEETSKRLFHFCKMMISADIKAYFQEHPEVQYKDEIIDASTMQLIQDPITEAEEKFRAKFF
jgi:hypothetical protein